MSISRCAPRRWPPRDAGAVTSRSRGPREQCAQADQIVGRRGEGHDPIDEGAAAMPELPQAAHGFHPPEDLFDQLPFSLTDGIAGVTRRPTINGAVLLLRNMRRD